MAFDLICSWERLFNTWGDGSEGRGRFLVLLFVGGATDWGGGGV